MKGVVILLVVSSLMTSCGWKCAAYPQFYPDGKGGVDVYDYNLRCTKRF